MKTAAFDTPFNPDLLTGFGLHRPSEGAAARSPAAAASRPEPEPVYWRSEAFAEDLSDLLPAEPATQRQRPFLRRALAAVLRR